MNDFSKGWTELKIYGIIPLLKLLLGQHLDNVQNFIMENFISLLFVVALIVTIWLMLDRRSRVKDGQTVDESLTTNEKILVWVLCLFDPIISGAIFYFGWKKKMPIKAKQANTISFAAFGIVIILAIIYIAASGDFSAI